eukprot:SAG25_NODE_504_length_7328_cov_2.718772_4_plen_21_part_01
MKRRWLNSRTSKFDWRTQTAS